MADRYGIYCASFAHAGGTLHLQQLDEQDLQAQQRYKTIRPGGAIDPAAHILSTANPRCRFRTCDLASLFTVLGSSFHLYCSGGHAMRYQKRLPGGAFAVGSDHFVQTTARGMLVVTAIEVDIDSDEGAYADLDYIPLSIAGENPITNTSGQSLVSAPAPAFGSQFFMGGSWLGAVQVLGLKSMRWQPGLQVVTQRSDGGVFPRADGTSINARTPIVSARYLNVALPEAIGSMFLAQMGDAFKGYLQRGTAAADGRIASVTTSHLRIQATAGSWGPDSLRVSGVDDGIAEISVMPTGALVPTLNVALGA